MKCIREFIKALFWIWLTALVVFYDPFVGIPRPWYQVNGLYAGAAVGSIVAGFLQGVFLWRLCSVKHILLGWYAAIATSLVCSPLLVLGFNVKSAGCIDWPLLAFEPDVAKTIHLHSIIFLFVAIPALVVIAFLNGIKYRSDRQSGLG